jgi:hypothetical protein
MLDFQARAWLAQNKICCHGWSCFNIVPNHLQAAACPKEDSMGRVLVLMHGHTLILIS